MRTGPRGSAVRAIHGLLAGLVMASVCLVGCGSEQAPSYPDRRFIRVGSTNGKAFTDSEVQELAAGYGYVLFTKFHAGYDIQVHHQDARRLKRANPDVRVLPYFSTKYWFDKSEWGIEPNPEWLLRDRDGKVVPKRRAGDDSDTASYVDLANPDYRRWALGVLAQWLQAAPYDGISFDAAGPIGDHDTKDIDRWDRLLGADRVAAYNAGLRDLLARARDLVGSSKEVIFNGIAPKADRGPGRDLDLLELTDGALDERFCVNAKGVPTAIDDDLTLMQSTTKRLFLRTSLPSGLSAEDRTRLTRFCSAVFLLGWQPGRTYFQVGLDYSAEQLRADDPDLGADLGVPRGPSDGVEVRTRSFARGQVVVNLGEAPVTVPDPAGGQVTVGPLDAVLFGADR